MGESELPSPASWNEACQASLARSLSRRRTGRKQFLYSLAYDLSFVLRLALFFAIIIGFWYLENRV